MSCVSHEPLLLLTPLPPLLLLLLSIPFVSSSQCAGEPPFPVLATCIVFLDHLQNVHIHAMRTKFQIVFSLRISDQNALCHTGHSDLRARPEAGTLGVDQGIPMVVRACK